MDNVALGPLKSPRVPFPATSLTMPSGPTRTTRWLLKSAMRTPPEASVLKPLFVHNCDVVAGTSSAPTPHVPVPANGVTVPSGHSRRTLWFCVSDTMTLPSASSATPLEYPMAECTYSPPLGPDPATPVPAMVTRHHVCASADAHSASASTRHADTSIEQVEHGVQAAEPPNANVPGAHCCG
jgi:hypothetical protein